MFVSDYLYVYRLFWLQDHLKEMIKACSLIISSMQITVNPQWLIIAIHAVRNGLKRSG